MERLPALLGGVVLFLFGMTLMGEHLQRLSGGRAERVLRRMTSSRWRGALLGFAVTAVIQSSSAATVLAVSLADAGVLSLRQAIPLIVGSNVGTTATAWLLCLGSGAPKGSALLTTGLALAGLALYLLAPRRKSWGGVLLGLFLLLTGMTRMTEAAAALADTTGFAQLLQLAEHPLFGLLAGMAFTSILQSSSASVGLLQAFSVTGCVTWGAAVPLVLGQNIGTCATVLLASIGGGPNAKRAAMAHLGFNILGTASLLPLWLVLGTPLAPCAIGPIGVAAIHTGFNLLSAALLLPLSDRLSGFLIHSARRDKVGRNG